MSRWPVLVGWDATSLFGTRSDAGRWVASLVPSNAIKRIRQAALERP